MCRARIREKVGEAKVREKREGKKGDGGKKTKSAGGGLKKVLMWFSVHRRYFFRRHKMALTVLGAIYPRDICSSRKSNSESDSEHSTIRLLSGIYCAFITCSPTGTSSQLIPPPGPCLEPFFRLQCHPNPYPRSRSLVPSPERIS